MRDRLLRSGRWLPLSLLLCVAGCGNDEREGCEGETCTSTSTVPSCGDGLCATPDESTESCPDDCSPCAPLGDVTPLLDSGELFFGYSVLGSADVTLGCGELDGSKEVAVTFTPEVAAELVLSTEHPSTQIDTAIELRQGSCDGEALGCSAQGSGMSPGARLTVSVSAGTPYVALVETADDEAGVFALGLHPVGVCDGEGATRDITDALLTGERYAVDTTASSSSLRGSCAEAGSNPEARFGFTAPSDGELVATTAHPATSFDVALYLRQGGLDALTFCDSPEAEIACATDGAPDAGGPLLRSAVRAGHYYDLLVDGNGTSSQGQATLTLGYAAASPATASLEGCDYEGIRDQYGFFLSSGQAAHLAVDTASAETAADTRLRVRLPDGTELYEADDDFDCTYPPPNYRCPQYDFTATTAGLYLVEIYVGSTESCFDRTHVDYQLTVSIDGQPADLILVRDQ